MLEIFEIVVPVFLILGAGYLAVRTNYMSVEVADHLNSFGVRLAVPVLLFLAMYKLDFAQAFNLGMLISFYAGAVVSFAIAIILARTIWKRPPGEAVAVGFCALFSNTVLLGVPIFERAYGADSLTQVFGIIAFHAPCMYALGFFTMEFSRRDGRSLPDTLKAVFKSIFSNALMIGILIGVALNLGNVKLPYTVMSALNMLASAAIPAALVGIGAALTRYSLKSELSETFMVTAFSIIVHPAIAFILAYYVFGLSQEYVRAAVVIGAMPSGINVYLFAVMYDRAVSLSASAILIATPISIVTISMWLSLLKYMGV